MMSVYAYKIKNGTRLQGLKNLARRALEKKILNKHGVDYVMLLGISDFQTGGKNA